LHNSSSVCLFLIDGGESPSYLCHHHCQKERKSKKKNQPTALQLIHSSVLRVCKTQGPRCGAMMELMGPFMWFGRYQSRLHACMELCSQYGTRFFGKRRILYAVFVSLDAVVFMVRSAYNNKLHYCSASVIAASCFADHQVSVRSPYSDGAIQGSCNSTMMCCVTAVPLSSRPKQPYTCRRQ
jgi:hypothetical protein